MVIENERLRVPHPRLAQRRFVLEPLADIAPGRVLPGQTKTVRELLASAPQTGRVLRSPAQWEV
jgi:2-amino-4-hydroxy-6-hydroxymethyldihydropteridine diphosphokinase